jgi:hypothetical protein
VRRQHKPIDIPPIPDSVTHFCRYGSALHLDRLQDIILNHRIYIPTAKQLNDPNEAKPKIAAVSPYWMGRFLKRVLSGDDTLTREQRERLATKLEYHAGRLTADELRRHTAELFYERTNDKTLILSMSLRWNNMSMWAKYSDNHRGYCLEFARNGWFVGAYSVVYDDTFTLDMFADIANVQADVAGPVGFVRHSWLFYKSPEWSNEEEVRFVLLGTYNTQFMPIQPRWLTRVILGKDMTPDDEMTVRDWARRRQPELHVVKARFDVAERSLRLT